MPTATVRDLAPGTRIGRLRWWMIGLLMVGSIINYLTRSTLAVAAPDAAAGPAHRRAAILLDRRRVHGRDHAAAALRLRARRARPEARLRASSRSPGRSSAWRTGWPTAGRRSSGLRGLLGLAEGSANPAGMKATVAVVSRAGARVRRRAVQHRRLRSARCSRRRSSPGRSSSHSWRFAFVLTGALGLVWVVVLAVCSTNRPTSTRDCRRGARATSSPGQEAASARRRPPPVDRPDPRTAQLLGHRAAALPRRSHLGHADVLAAALPDAGPALRSQADRALRLAAVPGRRSRLHVRAARSARRCSATPASA